jgi:hypothetical protein
MRKTLSPHCAALADGTVESFPVVRGRDVPTDFGPDAGWALVRPIAAFLWRRPPLGSWPCRVDARFDNRIPWEERWPAYRKSTFRVCSTSGA